MSTLPTVRPLAPSALERHWLLSDELFAVVEPDGRFHAVSPGWRRKLGWTDRELAGANPIDFVHPEDRDRAVQALELAQETGRATGIEIRYRHSDTSYRRLSWSGYRVDGAWYMFARDVPNIKAAESP
jgi:PAS domain S-box-containing protein